MLIGPLLAALAALTVAVAVSGCGSRSGSVGTPGRAPRAADASDDEAATDRARIRDVIRRFNQATLAGDTGAMCALVDPAKLRYLEQIGLPCEVCLGGTLTPQSERDVRSRTITSIEITGDDAVAHAEGVDGRCEVALRRSAGHWLIREVSTAVGEANGGSVRCRAAGASAQGQRHPRGRCGARRLRDPSLIDRR